MALKKWKDSDVRLAETTVQVMCVSLPAHMREYNCGQAQNIRSGDKPFDLPRSEAEILIKRHHNPNGICFKCQQFEDEAKAAAEAKAKAEAEAKGKK